MSVPRCKGPYPAAPAAPAPALEPPGFFERSHGLRASGWKLESPDDSMPESGMVVFAERVAPASRRRAAGGASAAAGTSLTLAAPSGTGWPLVAILSLIVTGTPSSAPVGSPFGQRSVDAFATVRAPSGSNA